MQDAICKILYFNLVVVHFVIDSAMQMNPVNQVTESTILQLYLLLLSSNCKIEN